MLKRLLSALAFASLVGAFAAPVAAQSAATAGADTPVDAREVRAWLTRIHDAAGHRNFQGIFVVNAGGTVSSARIAHFCVAAEQFERIDSLDGQMRQVFRHNDIVHTLWPQSRVAMVERRDLLTTFPALLQTGSDHIADFYDVRSQGSERVAARDALVLLLRPKDALRYGYRLWADRATGLLLRAEILGERGEVLEAAAFSDLSIGGKAQVDSVLTPMSKLDGYRVMRPSLTPVRLEAEGWSLRQPVPGFEPVGCVRRSLSRPGEDDAGASPQVLQAIYSDGLATVSIFIEPHDPNRHTRGVQASVGATQTLMRRAGASWVTVVGDVPANTLRQFSAALEYKK